jgi:[ribosomal protein S18]-alanine N-acetyltransferase
VGADLGSAVRLRGYEAGDLQPIFELDEICFEPPFRFSLRAMRRFAEAQNALTVIAESDAGEGGEIVGFCLAHLEPSGRQQVAYVVTLDVAPEHRRRGLAARMIRRIEEQARDAGCVAIGLHVWVGNETAIRFYEREGYERTRLARGFYGAGLDAFVYSKLIAPEGGMG